MLVSGGTPELQKNGAALARDARIIFEKLVRSRFMFHVVSLLSVSDNRVQHILKWAK
jgi:hypothetical protein